MNTFKENIGCIIPFVFAGIVISAFIFVPKTDFWGYRKMKRGGQITDCMEYIQTRPDGKYIDNALMLYTNKVSELLDEEKQLNISHARRMHLFNQKEVSSLARKYYSRDSGSELKQLSHEILDYYLEDNPDTEEFWKLFRNRVDEEGIAIADGRLSSIYAAWEIENGALEELRKYSTVIDDFENEDDRDLVMSKYEKYLETFPAGACADSMWKRYALFLKDYLTYMREHYIHEDEVMEYYTETYY